MTEAPKPRTAKLNGQLWGASARDWANLAEGQFRAGYMAVLARAEVGSDTQLLDAGCGAGMAAAMAHQLGATITGIDASSALLDIARERVPSGNFHQGDLEALPFEDATFDVVTGFNSFQYAGNPGVALTEARRVTKPTGVVCVMTWGNPEVMEAAKVVTVVKDLLPPPPPGAPGPFALSDETKLRQFGIDAGLEPVAVFDVDSPWAYSNEETALRGLTSSGVSAKAIETSGLEAVRAAYTDAIKPFRREDGSYKIGATLRVLIARHSTQD